MDDDIARAQRAKRGSPFLSTEQAAFYLGLSPRKLQQMRADGTGPRFRRHSRFVRYHIDEIECWSKGIPLPPDVVPPDVQLHSVRPSGDEAQSR